MDNDPSIDDFPMKTSMYSGFSMAMLVITRWYVDLKTLISGRFFGFRSVRLRCTFGSHVLRLKSKAQKRHIPNSNLDDRNQQINKNTPTPPSWETGVHLLAAAKIADPTQIGLLIPFLRVKLKFSADGHPNFG